MVCAPAGRAGTGAGRSVRAVDAVSGDDGPRPGVPEGADPSVDWPAAIRREERRGVLVALPVLGFPFGIVLLTGDFLGILQPAAWWVAAAIGLLLVAAGIVASALARRRQRPRTSVVVQTALHLRVDPGPALRDEADRTAHGKRSIR